MSRSDEERNAFLSSTTNLSQRIGGAPSNQGKQDDGKFRRKRQCIVGGLLLGLLASTGIIVWLILFLHPKNQGNDIATASSPVASPLFFTKAPTAAPNAENVEARQEEANRVFQFYSDPALLQNTESPQAKAFDWVVNKDQSPLERIQVRYILAVFYYSTQGETWEDQLNFLNPELDTCHWNNSDGGNGVICNEGFEVVGITLNRNNLQGSLPSELWFFTRSLLFLQLNGNEIRGTIPTEYGQFFNLERLELNSNLFNGFLPTQLGQLDKLQTLRLPQNDLEGLVPTEIGNLTSLIEMDLSGNAQLHGQIPSELGNLVHLKTVHLEHTRIIGDLNDVVCPLEQLEVATANCLPGGGVTCACCTTCCYANGGSCQDTVS